MTVIRNLFILFALASCGPNVKLGENKLENISPLSASEVAKYEKQGLLIKGQTNQVQYNGTTLTLSIYSSKSAQEFVAALPQGSQVPVIFTGGVSGNQVVIETIRRQ